MPPISEQTVAVVKLAPQERVQQRTVKQMVDVLVVMHRQVRLGNSSLIATQQILVAMAG